MKTIKTLDQLMTLIDTDSRPLYVRWSNGVAADRKMGCSRNHATGQVEPGVSVNGLRDVDNIFHPRGFAAMQIGEYAHICGPTCYVLTGDELGRGSDNEIVLDAETWTPIARIALSTIDDASGIHAATGSRCDHPESKRSRYAGGVEFCDKCGEKVA